MIWSPGEYEWLNLAMALSHNCVVWLCSEWKSLPILFTFDHCGGAYGGGTFKKCGVVRKRIQRFSPAMVLSFNGDLVLGQLPLFKHDRV